MPSKQNAYAGFLLFMLLNVYHDVPYKDKTTTQYKWFFYSLFYNHATTEQEIGVIFALDTKDVRNKGFYVIELQ